MKIVYMGHNQRGIACLKALNNSQHEIVHAVALEGEGGWYSSIDNTAKELGIPYSIVSNPNEDEFLEGITSLNPDLIVMCGYSKLVGRRLREIPKKGCINLHASLLPNYRGAAPLNWAIIRGEEKIGLSIYFVDKGMDTGPIILQEIIEVPIEHTIRNVLEKTLEIYPKMLLQVCDNIENGSVEAKTQDPDEGSYFTKRFPKDGEVNWKSMEDKQIYNLVRALTQPYPGAFFYYNGKKVFIWEASLEKRNYYGISGRVTTRAGGGVVIIAKNRGLRVLKVQVEGEEEIGARELFQKVGEDIAR